MIKKWLYSLNERERRFLFIGSIIAGVLLFYTIIYHPLTVAVSQTRTSIEENKSLLIWMQASSKKILKLKEHSQKKHEVDTANMLSTVHDSLVVDGLLHKTTKLSQIDANVVQIEFKRVSFDGLISWLATLQSNYTIDCNKISIRKLTAPGMVRALLILTNKVK